MSPRLSRSVAAARRLALSFLISAVSLGGFAGPGALDPTFDPGSGVDGVVHALAAQPDGKLLLGGQFWNVGGATRFRIARLNADGQLDSAHQPPQLGSDAVLSLAVGADGMAYVGGMFDTYPPYLQRLNTNGPVDMMYSIFPLLGPVRAMLYRTDGSLIIGGTFNGVGSTWRPNLARMLLNGMPDESFGTTTGVPGAVYGLAQQADGKIIVAGEFSQVYGVARQRLARLDPNGSVDSSFDPGSVVGSTLTSVAVQPDGKVLVGGGFFTSNAIAYLRLVRLMTNGAIDTSFSAAISEGGLVSSQPGIGPMVVQSSGSILIAGDFKKVNGVSRSRIARLRSDGSLDSSFDPGTGANGTILAMAPTTGDAVYIGGEFTQYDGVARARLARISAAAAPVLTAPAITVQPASQAVTLGAPLTLAVTAIGTAPLSYQWYKNGQLLGSTASNLVFAAVTAADGGIYAVVVRNDAGAVTSEPAGVTVQERLRFTLQPASQTVAVGARVAFSVAVEGTPPFTYQWRRQGTNLIGAANAVLSLDHAQVADAGGYSVVVTNPAGTLTSDDAILTVLEPPRITQQPASQAVLAGTRVTFTAAASGSAPFRYQWAQDGAGIARATNDTLVIESVKPTDAGNYAVIVLNGAGSELSQSAWFTVKQPPTIVRQPVGTNVIKGSTVMLQVRAAGESPFTFKWTRNGIPISTSNPPSAWLNLRDVQPTNAGIYVVTVRNAAGAVPSQPAVVTVLEPPAITQQPASQTVALGATVTLSAGASGTAPLSYQWKKNGASLAGKTGSTLSFAQAKASDAGSYIVEVTNSAGAITSRPATLTVQSPPSITQQPASQTVVAGASAKFSLTATGVAPMTYQWRKNNTNLPGGQGAVLTLPTVTTNDAGNYLVIVTNSGGSSTSQVAALTVQMPPGIVLQPASQTVVLSNAASFRVQANGTTPLTYQWRRGLSDLPGATSPTLILNPVKAADAGGYRVVVRNAAASATSQVAQLTVQLPPSIVQGPTSQRVSIHHPVSFTVLAAGTPPLRYQWRRNAAPLSGETNATLTLPDAQLRDTGAYSVVVSNPVSSVTSASASLTVLESPAISQQPLSQTVAVGAPVALLVRAEGAAPLACQWSKNGAELPTATNATLGLSSARKVDAGAYAVVVRNSAGSVASRTATLNVLDAPLIVRQPLSQTVLRGVAVSLTVAAQGSPALTYQWYRGDVALFGQTQPTLTLAEVTSADAARYTVTVANSVGSVSSQPALLSVVTPLPAEIDADGDGMPDSYELAHNLDPTSLEDAHFDPDGDGMSNLQEYYAGTDPQSDNSVLIITDLTLPLPSHGWRVTWASVPGRSYTLYRWNSPDLGILGNPVWTEIATVKATNSVSSGDDPSLSHADLGYYRVAVTGGWSNPSGPSVSTLHAAPNPAVAEGTVVLTVTANDASGIQQVTLLDGSTVLGSATRMDATTWQYLWPVEFLANGVHLLRAQALSWASQAGLSPELAYHVAIPSPQLTGDLGIVPIRANAFATNGQFRLPTGRVRLGLLFLSDDSTVTLDTIRNLVTGRGKVTLPGLGEIYDGNFTLDPASGWLTIGQTAGARLQGEPPAPSPVRLSSRVVITPTELSVQVLTGAMQGTGTVDLSIPDPALNSARFVGRFDYDPGASTLTVVGSFALGSVTGNGVANLQLDDSTFTFTGDLQFAAGTAGGGMALVSASFSVTFGANGEAQFAVSGRHTLPDGHVEDMIGGLDPDGSLRGAVAPALPAIVRDYPGRFVPLGPDGLPVENGPLVPMPDGSLPPLEYRPIGSALFGLGQHFHLRFPHGATLVERNSEWFLVFEAAEAGFGPLFPLQLIETLSRPAGSQTELRIGPIGVGDIAAIFGPGLEGGLPVKAFGAVSLLWKAGALDEIGIKGASFGLADTGLPLPEASGVYSEFQLDLTSGEGLRIPLHGEFSLPDGSGSEAALSVGPQNPLWLTIRPNGQIALQGRAELRFSDGPRFKVDINFDDPIFSLQVAAEGLHFALLDSLSQLLPTPSTSILPQTATGPELRIAAENLRRHALASFNFSSAVAGAGASPNPGEALPSSPPGATAAATSALDAWSYSLLAEARANLPSDSLKTLFLQTSESATSARDLESVAAYRLALERARSAARQANIEADLDTAIAAVAAAATRRASEADAVTSLNAMREVARMLLEAQTLDEIAGSNITDGGLRDALDGLLRRFAEAETTRLGVKAGQFEPEANPIIAGMNRFVALETLRDLVGLMNDENMLGLDIHVGAPINEALAQLGFRLEAILSAALNTAALAPDYPGFLLALQDYLDLTALAQLGVFPTPEQAPATAGLHQRIQTTLASLASRLGQVAEADPNGLRDTRSPKALAAQVRRLLRIIQQVPSSVTLVASPFERAHNSMAEALQQIVINLDAQNNPETLADLVEASVLHVLLGRRFNLPVDARWQDQYLVSLVDRLLEKAGANNAWADLWRATQTLLAEPTAQTDADLQFWLVRLRQAQKLAAGSVRVADSVWHSTQNRPFAMALADMLLPGDVRVERVAGALRFNRLSHDMSGAFSGQLVLPSFDGSLTIQNASFASGGEFDLCAFGTLVVPKADNPLMRLTITPRRPLHVQFRAPNRLGISGGGQVTANGMTFGAFLTLEDPIYGFGLSASGLRFDLADRMHGTVPVLNTDKLKQLPSDLNQVAREYFSSLGGTFESLTGLATPPAMGEVGDPPEFAAPVVSMPADELNFIATGIIGAAAFPAVLGYVVTDEAVDQVRTATTPIVKAFVADLLRECRRAARDVRNARERLITLGDEARQQAESELADLLAGWAKAIRQALEAIKQIRIAQGSGRLDPGDDVNPEGKPEPEDALTETLDSLCALLASPRVLPKEKTDQLFKAWLEAKAANQLRASPTEDPCKQGAQDYFERARKTELADIGLDENGNVVDQTKLNRASTKALDNALNRAGEWESRAQALGEADNSDRTQNIARTILKREIEQIDEDARKLDGKPETYRVDRIVQDIGPRRLKTHKMVELLGVDVPGAGSAEYARDLGEINQSIGKLCDFLDPNKPSYDPWFANYWQKRRTAEMLARVGGFDWKWRLQEAWHRPNLVPGLAQFFQDNLNRFANREYAVVEQWFASPSFELGLKDALQIGHDLVGLASLLEETGKPASARTASLQGLAANTQEQDNLNRDLLGGFKINIFPKYKLKLTALAEARKAWWLMSRLTEVLVQAAGGKASADRGIIESFAWDSAQETLAAARDLINALQEDIDWQNKPVDLKLPGDLALDDVFGEVFYNRQDSTLSASFGGRLSFPESDFYVDVVNASINNQGRFSFAGGLGAPLPIGGLRLNAQVSVEGGLPLPEPGQPPGQVPLPELSRFSGNGTLFFPKFQGQSGESSAQMGIDYNREQQTVTLSTSANNLDLRLGDHVVLFNAGGTLKFGGQDANHLPRSGEVILHGTAGLFRNNHPPNDSQRPSKEDYLLVGDDITAKFATTADGFEMSLVSGRLLLPDFCTTSLGGASDRAAIDLKPETPLKIAVVLGPPNGANPPEIVSVRLSGALGLENIGLAVPGIANLAAEIFSGTLSLPVIDIAQGSLPDASLPGIQIERGQLKMPLPPGKSTTLELRGFQWRLDGFPSGQLLLATNLLVFGEPDGFSFTVLGGNSCGPEAPATAITIEPAKTVNNETQLPKLTLNGGVRLMFPADFLKDQATGSRAGVEACGSVTLEGDHLPALALDDLAFGGDFVLGDTGARITGDRIIAIENITHLFDSSPSAQEAFRVVLSGDLSIPNGPIFGMQNMRLVFRHSNPDLPFLPDVNPGTFLYKESQWELVQQLPLRAKSGVLRFKDGNVPLKDMFRPTNLELTLSLRLAIPTDDPIFSGDTDGVKVTFNENGLPIFSLRGIGVAISGLDIPPIENIGGRVYIGGLDSLEKIFFAGQVRGVYGTVDLDLLLAFSARGPVGVCVRGTVSGAGIPLDAYQLGGILLNGASGGISLANNAGDPCAFKTYMDEDGNPKFVEPPVPPLTWEQLRQFVERFGERLKILPQRPGSSGRQLADALDALATLASLMPVTAPPANRPQLQSQEGAEPPTMTKFNIPCPEDCPPPTINIFCQPHPDQASYTNRVIAKFSSIDEPALNSIGITRDAVRDTLRDAGGTVESVVLAVAQKLRNHVDSFIPRPPNALPKADEINQILDESLATLEGAFTLFLNEAVNAIAGEKTADKIYDEIVRVAYMGAPCPDVTLKLTGIMTHQYVSSFMSGEAGAIISTAGSAGVVGNINIMGVPAGQLQAYIAGTDKNGDFNPSLCGQLDAEIGPLKLGKMALSLVGLASPDAARKFFEALGPCVGATVLEPLVNQVAAYIVTAGKSSEQLLGEMTDEERFALLAALCSQSAEFYELPGVKSIVPCLAFALREGWNQYSPEFRLCGELRPKLLGLPLGPDLADAAVHISKTNLLAATTISPSGTLAYCLTMAAITVTGVELGAEIGAVFEGVGAAPGAVVGGVVGAVVGGMAGGIASTLFSFDRVQIAMTLDWPDPVQPLLAGLEGRLRDKDAVRIYMGESLDYLLQNATYTYAYQLTPLGFKIASAEERVIMPNWDAHPARPGTHWVAPENRGLPHRADLLMAVVTNRLLTDVRWKGSSNDLHTVFAEGSPERASIEGKGLSLFKDYFPHGGFLLGGYVLVPRALVSQPMPEELRKALDPSENKLARLVAAGAYLDSYVLQSVSMGAMCYYEPAPSPPFFLDEHNNPLSPMELLKSINAFNPENPLTLSLFPADLYFFRGYMDGTLLGVPIGHAEFMLVPPDFIRGNPAVFRVSANVPTNSWLNAFVDSASLTFEMKQAPNEAIYIWSSNLVARVKPFMPTNQSDTAWTPEREQALGDVLNDLVNNLPKVSLEAKLDNFHVPEELAGFLAAPPGSANFTLFAYSPRFEPNFHATDFPDDGPVARARREGGLAVRGDLRFGDLVTVENAELSILPRGDGVPVLSGYFKGQAMTWPGGLSASADLEFTTDPAPSLKATGHLGKIVLPPENAPLMEFVPADGQPDFGIALDVTAGAPSTFTISPAQLIVRGIFGDEHRFLAYGADATKPFTFRTDGPWEANVTYAGSGALEVRAGNQVLLRDNRTAAESWRINRDNAGVVRLTKKFVQGGSVTVFSGQSGLEQQIQVAAGGELAVASDGTFSLSVALDPITLGATSIAPGFILKSLSDTDTKLHGRIEVLRDGQGAYAAYLVLSPARLVMQTSLFDPARVKLTVDGGDSGKEFRIATAGPWNARVLLEGTDPLVISAHNTTLASINQSALGSLAFSRDAAGVYQFELRIKGGEALTFFPGQPEPLKQQVKFAADALLKVGSDHRFVLSGQVLAPEFGPFRFPTGFITVRNDTQPVFALGAESGDTLTVGPLVLKPQTNGGKVDVRFEIRFEQGAWATALSASPCKVVLPSLSDTSIWLDGGLAQGATNRISFRSDAPWQARATFKDTFAPTLAGRRLLSIDTTGLEGTLQGNGLQSASLSLDIAPTTTVILYPNPNRPTFGVPLALNSAPGLKGHLEVATTGAFALSGQLDVTKPLPLGGFPMPVEGSQGFKVSYQPEKQFAVTLFSHTSLPLLPPLALAPQTEGGTVDVQFEIGLDNGQWSLGFSASPSRLLLPTLTESTLWLDGNVAGSTTNRLTFRTAGPWQGRTVFKDALRALLAGRRLMEINITGLETALVGDGLNSASLNTDLAATTVITLFPGSTLPPSASLVLASGTLGKANLELRHAGGFTLNGRLDTTRNLTLGGFAMPVGSSDGFRVTSEPGTHFGVGLYSGTSLPVGVLSLKPQPGQPQVDIQFDIGVQDNQWVTSLSASPCRLVLPSLTDTSIWLDGYMQGVTAPNSRISFKTQGPWQAHAVLKDEFYAKLLGRTLIRVGTAGLEGALTGNGLTSASVGVDLSTSTTIALFPGGTSGTPPPESRVTLSPNTQGRLDIANNGAFTLTGRTDSSLVLGGFTLPTGSSDGFRVSSDPGVHFAVGVWSSSSLPLGVVSLAKQPGQSNVDAQFDVWARNGQWVVGLSTSPCRLLLPTLTDTSIYLDGLVPGVTPATNRVTFQTQGNWLAHATFKDSFRLRLLGNRVFEANIVGLEGTFSGNGLTAAGLEFALNPKTDLWLCPDSVPLPQFHLPLASGIDASLAISSDGAFTIRGKRDTRTELNLGLFRMPIGQADSFAITHVPQSMLAVTLASTTGVPIGPLLIRPQTSGAEVDVQLELRAGESKLTASLSASPCAVPLPTLTDTTLFLDGLVPGSLTNRVSLSTTQPWQAHAWFQDVFALKAAGQRLLAFTTAGLDGVLNGTGTNSLNARLAWNAATTVEVLPDNAGLKQTVTLQPGVNGYVSLSSTGDFALVAQAGQAVPIPTGYNLPLGQLSAGLQFRVSYNVPKAQGWVKYEDFAGASFGSIPGASVQGTLSLDLNKFPDAPIPSLTATASLDPIRVPPARPVFEVLSANSDKLSATFTQNGAKSQLNVTGAKLRVNGLFQEEILLPAFDVRSDGNFSVGVPSSGELTLTPVMPSPLPPLPAWTAHFTLKREAGVLSMDLVTKCNGLPGPTFTGTVTADGTLDLSGTPMTDVDLFGFRVNMSNRLLTYASLVKTHQPEAYWRLGDQYKAAGTALNPRYQVNEQMGRYTLTVIAATPSRPVTNPVAQDEPGALASSGDSAFKFTGGQVVVVQNLDAFPEPMEPAFDSQGPLALEVWVKVQQFTKPNQAILTKGASWALQRSQSTGKVSFATGHANATTNSLVSTRLIDDGRWHHLVAAFDGEWKYLYVDGALDSSIYYPQPLALNNYKVQIGGNAQYADRVFNGWLDEVAIYKRAISPDDVAAHYRAGKGEKVFATTLDFRIPTVTGLQCTGYVFGRGDAVLTGHGQSPNFGGFPFAEGDARFTKTTQSSLGTLEFNGNLNLPPLPVNYFEGRIDPSGGMGLINRQSGSIDYLGFQTKMTNILVAVSSGYSDAVKADGPEAFWRLDENYLRQSSPLAYVVNDQMGRHRLLLPITTQALGVQQNQESTVAGGNTSFKFTGFHANSIDYLSTPSAQEAAFNFAGGFSLETWIKVDQFNSPYQAILTKGDSAWRLQRDAANNTLAFDTTGLTPMSLTGRTPVNDTRWHHVVAVYDGQAKYLYVDGYLDAWQTVTGKPNTNDRLVAIGGNVDYPDRAFNGWLDEVSIYARGLSQFEVLQHYGASAGLQAFITSQALLDIPGLTDVGLKGGVVLLPTGPYAWLQGKQQTGNLAGFPFKDVSFDLKCNPGQSTATCAAEAVLDFDRLAEIPTPWGGNLRVLSPVTGLPEVRFKGSLSRSGADYVLGVSADPGKLKLLGYEFSGPKLGLTNRVSTPGSMLWKGATPVGLPFSLPALKGTLTPTTLAMDEFTLPNRTIAGFSTPTLTVRFNQNDGLWVSGLFDLKATVAGRSVDFGDISFSGALGTSPSLHGTGTLDLMGFTTSSAEFRLSSDGLWLGGSGLPTFRLGSFTPSISDLHITTGGLASFAAQSISSSTGWKSFFDWFPTGNSPGDVSGKVDWTVSFGKTDAGGFGASASVTLKIRENQGASYNEQSFSKSAAVNSNGEISVSQPFTTLRFEFTDPDKKPFSGDEYSQWGNSTWNFDLW